jgi:phage host-nuclease inhibitor protein Gam
MEADDAALVVAEVDDRFRVHDASSASWVIRKVNEERAHRARVQQWCEAEIRRSESRERFLLFRFERELEDWTRQELAKQHGSRRSIHLPGGTVAIRIQPTSIIVADESKLLSWCRQHLPSAVKVVESILKSELHAHVKQTGECPDGAEIAGGHEKFVIKK